RRPLVLAHGRHGAREITQRVVVDAKAVARRIEQRVGERLHAVLVQPALLEPNRRLLEAGVQTLRVLPRFVADRARLFLAEALLDGRSQRRDGDSLHLGERSRRPAVSADIPFRLLLLPRMTPLFGVA